MSARRCGASVIIGAAAFLLAGVMSIVMVYVVYGPIDYSGADRAGETTRRLLAWLASAVVLAPVAAVLLAVPFAAARRWRTSSLIAFIVAMALAGVTADYALRYLSYINDCTLGQHVPYTMVNCDDD